jgi:pyruvate/2-oxoglutarate dehydrogenase complex dihydrolipoamide acyltransferase (E2) component
MECRSVMNSANDKYGSSLDRPLAAGKSVDPATRLSELLAQSLDELTRPFEPPRGAHPSRPAEPRVEMPPASPAPRHEPPPEPAPPADPEQARADADKALAELEAELFAAAKQVDRDDSIPHAEAHADDEEHPDRQQAAESEAPPPAPVTHDSLEADLKKELAALASPAGPPRPAPEAQAAEPSDDAATAVIARVRRLMLISMAVTIIAVGSVFGFIGYRIFKGEGSVEKRADKLPAPPAIPTEITLSIPRGAKVIQSAVANDRLVMTLEIDGKIEVRTFDVKTLQPAGRLNFSATP